MQKSNVAFKTLSLIVSDRQQVNTIQQATSRAIKKVIKDNKIISIVPFLKRNAGYINGGFVA